MPTGLGADTSRSEDHAPFASLNHWSRSPMNETASTPSSWNAAALGSDRIWMRVARPVPADEMISRACCDSTAIRFRSASPVTAVTPLRSRLRSSSTRVEAPAEVPVALLSSIRTHQRSCRPSSTAKTRPSGSAGAIIVA